MGDTKKTKKIIVFTAVLAAALSCTVILRETLSLEGIGPLTTAENPPEPADESLPRRDQGEQEEQAVRKLVEDFGKKLQMVSLLAPEDRIAASIEENYGDYVTDQLMQKWQADPLAAPGRAVSSPWPDRIDILRLEMSNENRYTVYGEIIEITSAELENGGAAAKRPVTLMTEKVDGRWLIGDVTAGQYDQPGPVVYENTEYGFRFSLPETWEGYTVVEEQWEGISGTEVAESGPRLLIRHPDWTRDDPRQDIPLMIFTPGQWSALQNEEFSVGAAPIGPSKLGSNSQYVFALPARYNFAFPTGFEEVEEIINGHPLWPSEPAAKDMEAE
ncbi:MAG: hypothetical protein VB085_01370 [Peptococcaceae bacterium]|nr:hypothetical protein [Peptococcaceae bacterium]